MRFSTWNQGPLRGAITAAALLAAGAGVARADDPQADAPLPRMVRMSDERQRTQWAHPEARGAIFREASRYSARVGRLRLRTEDRFPEVYIVLRQYTDSNFQKWLEVRIPGRPNGRKGWVRRETLGTLRTNTQQLVVNRTMLRATLYDGGRRVWSARVGIGAAGTGTPAGRYYVREKFTFQNAPVYGTRAIGTSAYAPGLSDWPNGGVIGIHGTDQPGLIPGRVSHGCVRVRNKALKGLYRRIRIGTPIQIR